MARQERNNVDYFPFLCKEGKAMYYIETTYGNDGFATWIKILRELAVTNYHYLALNEKVDQMYLASKCKVDLETLISIINDLCEMDEFDMELWKEKKVVWCQKLVDSIQDAYKKRKNVCMSKRLLLTRLGLRKHSKSTPNGDGNEIKGDENTQTKVNYTKEEKSKEKERRENELSAFQILKNFKQQRLDELWMQNHRNISDKEKLIKSFNIQANFEFTKNQLEFEPDQLLARFEKYLFNWVSNEVDDKKANLDKQNQNQPVQRIEKRNYF